MFGIDGGELIVLLVVVALVVGPERLPAYAEQLGKWARNLRHYVQDARQRVDDEMGDTTIVTETTETTVATTTEGTAVVSPAEPQGQPIDLPAPPVEPSNPEPPPAS